MRKTIDIGQYITAELSNSLRSTYRATYPDTPTTFTIEKAQIVATLNLSENVAGIRFTYGLRDPLNPNSISIFLVPCASASEYSQQTMPLLFEQGYYDHTGTLYSLLTTTAFIGHFVSDQIRHNPRLTYKNATRGSFFGRNSLLDLLKDETTHAVTYTMGLEDNIIHPVLASINKKRVNINSLQLERAKPCPPFCRDEDDPACLATEAAEHTKNTVILDQFRQFRDEILLDIPEGPQLYELYYFISPFITHCLYKELDPAAAFRKFQQEQVQPFRALLDTGNTDGAIALLRTTLERLAETYQMN